MTSSTQQDLPLPLEMTIESAVDLAIANVNEEGLTDVFHRPFECDFLRIPDFVVKLTHEVVASLKGRSYESLRARPIYYTLQPKSRRVYDFRKVALIQPLDAIKYLALAILCAQKVEAARPPAHQNRIFSYRFAPQPSGLLWDPAYSMTSFYLHTQKMSQQPDVKVVVHCDIANFYDRLNLHRLQSTLQDLGLDPWLTKCLNDLLTGWVRRDSYGLPVGSSASRILAEAALIEVDRHLLDAEVKFCRFVDDYRMFAPDVQTAQAWLCRLLNRLGWEGLTLNASKTRVRPASFPEQEEVVPERPKGMFIPRVGYGRVPRRFLQPTADAIEELKNQPFSARQILEQIESQPVVEADKFEYFVRLVVAKEEFDSLVTVHEVLRKCPPYTDYIVDVLAKYKDKISGESRRLIANGLGEFALSQELPEWHAAQLIRLLSTEEYQNPITIRTLLRMLRKDAGVYLTRVLMEGFESFASRGDQYELKGAFERAEPWERRAILKIMRKILPDEEYNAWVRYAAIHVSDDPFSAHVLRPFESRKNPKRGNKTDPSPQNPQDSEGA